MKLLVVVPARGGSKGLPGKNLERVGGITLVGRSVRIGVAAAAVWATKGPAFGAKVVVDTDDEAIAEEGRGWGAEVPFLRDAALAGDAVAMFDNVDAAVRRWADRGFAADAVLLLQPTSPLRSLDDVLGCLSVFESQPTSVEAVVACEHPPEQTLRLGGGGVLTVAFGEENATRRRQDYQAGYRSSGSAYVTSVASLRASRSFLVPGETRGVVVARERAIDVDDRADLELARALHAQRAIAAPPWPATDTPGFVLNDTGDALLPAPGDPPLNVGNAANGPVRIAATDAGLVDEIRTIEAMAPAFVVAPHLTAFFALREAVDLPVVLSSSSVVEHAVALSCGARGFVAPAALHAAIHEVVPFVRPSSGLPTAQRRLAELRRRWPLPPILPSIPVLARSRPASSRGSTSKPRTW